MCGDFSPRLLSKSRSHGIGESWRSCRGLRVAVLRPHDFNIGVGMAEVLSHGALPDGGYDASGALRNWRGITSGVCPCAIGYASVRDFTPHWHSQRHMAKRRIRQVGKLFPVCSLIGL
jgi:hypothetical protein